MTLKLRRKVTIVGSRHTGVYFPADVLRSAGIRAGMYVDISVPSKGQILIEAAGGRET